MRELKPESSAINSLQVMVRLLLTAGFISAGCALPGYALAESGFEEAFLLKDKNGVSPEVFITRNAVSPGLKQVDIRVNDQLAENWEVLFVVNKEQLTVPCLTYSQLKMLGLKVSLYEGWITRDRDSATTASDAEPQQCEDLLQRIPASLIRYDDASQVLQITVPQEAVDRQRFAMISPLEWDEGVPSLRTAYRGYYYSSSLKGHSGNGGKTNDSTFRSAYISLNSVGTLGAWRFYSIDSFYRNPGKGWDSNHDRSYIARDIAALRSQFQAGEIYSRTSGYMTGTVPVSGVSLATSERMLLDNQFRYAPVIRGVARTNARLVVRQRGNIIYSNTLTPGPFAIDDLYSAQVGADLDVTVEESDGQFQVFRVPYTALPNMIRPGAFRYSATAGKYRSQNAGTEEPLLATGSLEYGFEHFTLNSSLLTSEDYQSLSTGLAWNIGNIGAFSTEVAYARHRETWNKDQSQEGSAVRFLYARYFDLTATSLQILGYQYRSKNYLDFSEFISRHSHTDIDGFEPGQSEWNRRKRSRVEMNVNQNLYDFGNLYLSLSQDRFYGTGRKSTSISGGTGTTIGPASVSLSWTHTRDSSINDNILSLSVSLPLGGYDERRSNYGSVNYGLTRDRDNRYSQSLGYSGSALDNAVSYSANVQRSSQGKYSESGSLGYNGSMANLSGGVSHSSDYNQYSAGMSGGVTLYSGGAILSPALGDTIAIVETPGASGIGVSGNNRARTDYFGHAVVTYLTPYRYNTVSLDTSGTENVELKESSRKVVPTPGAAVHLKFATRVGRRAMVEIRSARSVPLGAMVYLDGEKDEAGIVGNKGLTYLSGLDARQAQTLRVVWGEGQNEHCTFTVPAATEEQRKPENWHHKIVVDCR
ncbi:TPA: fimbria/pilus outer membrane usher protein [Citrobacter farmeri]|uniref:Fimbrial biogenesis outer membrane usher protein n=1 Tax=Citrobacter farmeri TaxID=67824 RepID=A0ACA8D7P2_9ENTR|nr:fimbria/pilus outer membrane usher protein [Citrobacter farmeri]HAT2169155.1 fimbrial biogenesis outer membrane usher protein [Citrobacter freundii]AST80051.1 fimbrial biogenesis outer membrane usher protein [Citrobacter farmeri]QXA99335.1 fimbrial biogenesis outer membrane usher protein [Citrobacter farmeri]GAL48468.1 putative fimbrial usher protein [Citrobacter farmeri GTC 1319]HAT2486488.1 fimbrial biogenesis outer membrane usher protein [Citrobacter freundii]